MFSNNWVITTILTIVEKRTLRVLVEKVCQRQKTMNENNDCNRETRCEENRIQEFGCQVRDHPAWRFREVNGSFEERLDRSMTAWETGETVEYWFDHVETKGTLRMTIPAADRSTTLARGTLNQALDHRQRSNAEVDPFLKRLIRRHQQIAERYSGEIISSAANPVSIVKIEVPFSCDKSMVDDALTRISKCSQDVQQIHERVIEVLQHPSQE
jgi:hypothetical protein